MRAGWPRDASRPSVRSGRPSSWPWSSRSTRSQRAASSGSWVTITTAVRFCCRDRQRRRTRRAPCRGRGCRSARRPARTPGASPSRARSPRAGVRRRTARPDGAAAALPRPTAFSASSGLLARIRQRHAPDRKRHRDIVQRGELRQQVMELVDEAQRARCAGGRVRRRSAAPCRGLRPCTSPRSAASSPPSTCNSVLLPEPDAPTIATISAGATSSSRRAARRPRVAPSRYDLARAPRARSASADRPATLSHSAEPRPA